MLKLRKEGVEYEVLGHITFKPNEEEETLQTNYTIVLDGETVTIESTDTSFEVIEVEDVVVEPEPIVEPEPVVEPTPEPTPEELAALEASRIAHEEMIAFNAAKSEWLQKKQALATMIDDMERGKLLDIAPNQTQLAIMQGLANWVNANMKQEYYF